MKLLFRAGKGEQMVKGEQMETHDLIKGWGSGLLGVIIFSMTLPATRLAIIDFSPIFLTAARAFIAAIVAAAILRLLRQTLPARQDLLSLAIVALSIVIGFPLLTALALQYITSAYSMNFICLLPLSTAIFGVMRGRESARPLFWVFSGIGSCIFFIFSIGSSVSDSRAGDILMVIAVIVCGLGYAEGAVLARRIGSWQVISWSLILAAPFMLALAFMTQPSSWHDIAFPAWLSLAYVSLFSSLIGFLFWYRGLALAGIAQVGQLQLLLPFFGLVFASLLLDETISWSMIAAMGLVVLCIALAKRFA